MCFVKISQMWADQAALGWAGAGRPQNETFSRPLRFRVAATANKGALADSLACETGLLPTHQAADRHGLKIEIALDLKAELAAVFQKLR